MGNHWARSALASDEAAKVLHRLTHLSSRVGRRVWSRARRYDRSGKMVLSEGVGWMASSWSHCLAVMPACQTGAAYSTVGRTKVCCRTEASPWSARQHGVGRPRSLALAISLGGDIVNVLLASQVTLDGNA